MIITSIRYSKNVLYDIFVDGEFLCTLEDIDIARLKLVEGVEAESDELLTLACLGAARRDGLKLLLYKKYASGDLRAKLVAKGHGGVEAEAAVEHFKVLGYIDDADYAKRYAADAVRLRHEGAFRIRMALKEKGVPDDDIDRVLAGYAKEIGENLKKLISKGGSDVDKLRRKLVYKGYEFEDINKWIKDKENG